MDPAEIERQFDRYREMFHDLEVDHTTESDALHRAQLERNATLEATRREVAALEGRRSVANVDIGELRKRSGALDGIERALQKEIVVAQASVDVHQAELDAAAVLLDETMEQRGAAAEDVILLQVELRELSTRIRKLEQEEMQLTRTAQEAAEAQRVPARSERKKRGSILSDAHTMVMPNGPPPPDRIAAMLQRLNGMVELANLCVEKR